MSLSEFDRELLGRVPLAESVLSVLSYVCQEDFVNDIFDRHRGRCYEGQLSFSTMVNLIHNALLEHDGSARQAFGEARKDDQLPASDQAAYGKLRRLPIEVSEAFLADCTMRLEGIFPSQHDSCVPDCLSGFHVFCLDGKKIKKVAKRLKPARGVKGKLLGGKAVVARSLHERLAAAIHADCDGEVNDGPLVPGLLEQIHQRYEGPLVWVMDSQFCDLTTPRRILENDHHFVVRYHPKVNFHRANGVEIRQGIDSRQRSYEQDTGHLGSPSLSQQDRVSVRRIRVKREGKDDLVLITSLLDYDEFPADQLLTVYALRWSIETMFQQVTEVFSLKRLIGSSPKASVFQFSFCLLLYNIIELVRAHIGHHHQQAVEDISMKKVFDDVHKQLVAIHMFVRPAIVTLAIERPWTASQVRDRISQLIGRNWNDDWKKAPNNKRHPPPKPRTIPGGHTSVQRLIEQQK